MEHDFLGAHVALFLGDRLLVILRDDFAHIPSPNCWDFPGGTRDPGEAPLETLVREVFEETALMLDLQAICWARRYPALTHPGAWNWFYVARMEADLAGRVVLGDEGQCWQMMTTEDYLALPNPVPSFPPQLRAWLAEEFLDKNSST